MTAYSSSVLGHLISLPVSTVRFNHGYALMLVETKSLGGRYQKWMYIMNLLPAMDGGTLSACTLFLSLSLSLHGSISVSPSLSLCLSPSVCLSVSVSVSGLRSLGSSYMAGTLNTVDVVALL